MVKGRGSYAEIRSIYYNRALYIITQTLPHHKKSRGKRRLKLMSTERPRRKFTASLCVSSAERSGELLTQRANLDNAKRC